MKDQDLMVYFYDYNDNELVHELNENIQMKLTIENIVQNPILW